MTQSIYCFADKNDIKAIGKLSSDQAKSLVGGKGAGLFEMARLGIVIPPGFTVTTDVCRSFFARKERLNISRANERGSQSSLLATHFLGEFDENIKKLEKAVGRGFGDRRDPLLLSVRSGSKFSMPGMMDTILNLGLNGHTVLGLEEQTKNPRFAWDCYRRFIAMFGNVVKEIDKGFFEAALTSVKARAQVKSDSDLSTESLQKLVKVYKEIYREHAGSKFPEDPKDQIQMAVIAVFESWNNPRAIAYRHMNRLAESLGTACTIQGMVFGNMGDDCATGVCFTRNPANGEKKFYGEFLINAQGEDVVSGVRTPRPILELKNEMPAMWTELNKIAARLETHYKDVQDLEFTVEKGRLYMLQTRVGKRTARSALRAAVDMVAEGLITKETAVTRVAPDQLNELLRPVFHSGGLKRHEVLGTGLPAGPGAATGRIAFSAEAAEKASKAGPVILVRPHTNPDDIKGMVAAVGILTQTGGMTSHASVVGRGLGKVCVVGCAALDISEAKKTLRVNGKTLNEGDYLSLNGFNGNVIAGQVPTQPSAILQVLRGDLAASKSPLFQAYKTFMGWVDQTRRLKVRANADTPEDARTAIALGASGIGLCRTEHMFFIDDRIEKMFAVIISDNDEHRYKSLAKLFPLQKNDFKDIFRAMKGLPVTIRAIDPPLHEFLPADKASAQKLCKKLGFDKERIWTKIQELKESNPMLGHRGCRLGITHPEITEMQVRAIISAACEVQKEGIKVFPEIMIPLVGHVAEFKHQKARVRKIADETMTKYKTRVNYLVGTMIEVPRAALTAGEIAEEAEFFSFGTNDLTQMTLGYSRDDYGRFIRQYMELKILLDDPFVTLDQSGVGQLVRAATQRGRKARKDLKVGICGEHGGDPASIEFFDSCGLEYVSCSPYRVPIARLAAAQAAIRNRQPGKKKHMAG